MKMNFSDGTFRWRCILAEAHFYGGGTLAEAYFGGGGIWWSSILMEMYFGGAAFWWK